MRSWNSSPIPSFRVRGRICDYQSPLVGEISWEGNDRELTSFDSPGDQCANSSQPSSFSHLPAMPRHRRTKRPRPRPQILPQIAPGRLPIFLTLAVEIIEHIVSFLDRPRDLLSLALTSKRTLRIIIPIHLQTRLIRCDIRRIILWKLLGTLPPIIATRFVSLQIVEESFPFSSMPESDVVLPVFLFHSSGRHPSTTNRTEAMEQLVATIPLMPSLKSFRLESTKTSVTSNLITVLRDSCPNISDLRFGNNSFWPYNETLHSSVRLLDMTEPTVKH